MTAWKDKHIIKPFAFACYLAQVVWGKPQSKGRQPYSSGYGPYLLSYRLTINAMYKILRHDISIEQARQYLASNNHNRTLSPTVVAAYVDMMRNGQWGLNIDPICFGTGGELLNGQHRLSACIEAGIPLTDQIILTDLPLGSFEHMDNGFERSIAQIMKMDGIAYSGLVSSLVSAFIAFERCGIFITQPGGKLFAGKSLAYLESNPWIQDIAPIATGLYKQNRLLTPVVYAIVHRQMGLLSEPARDTFLSQFTAMTDLKQGSPVLALIKTLQRQKGAIKNGNKGTTLERSMQVALVIKAFKYYVKGNSLQYVTISEDERRVYQKLV